MLHNAAATICVAVLFPTWQVFIFRVEWRRGFFWIFSDSKVGKRASPGMRRKLTQVRFLFLFSGG